jgi:hypothetical protein
LGLWLALYDCDRLSSEYLSFPQPTAISTAIHIHAQSSKNTGARSPLEKNKFWLATNFRLDVRKSTFGVLDVSFGHLWHGGNDDGQLPKI